MSSLGRKFTAGLLKKTSDYNKKNVQQSVDELETIAQVARMKGKELQSAAKSEDDTLKYHAQEELKRRTANNEVKKDLKEKLNAGEITEKQYKNRLNARTQPTPGSESLRDTAEKNYERFEGIRNEYKKGGMVKKKTKPAAPKKFSVGGYANMYGKK